MRPNPAFERTRRLAASLMAERRWRRAAQLERWASGMDDAESALAVYRSALLAAASGAAGSHEESLYQDHVRCLAEFETAFVSSDAIGDLKPLVALERRTFGWSFLPGSEGEAVEEAFHRFASIVEATSTGRTDNAA